MLIFEPPDKVLGETLSKATLDLMAEIKKDTGFSVRFVRFEDHEEYKSCRHYASGGIRDDKVPTVYLNCSKVLGHVDLIVNHELLHICLDREGYPKLECFKDDVNANKIAALLRSVIEHPIIQQRQCKIGISDEDFQNEQVRKTVYCSPPNSIGYEFTEGLQEHDALRYAEFMLMCKDKSLLMLLDKTYAQYAPNAMGLGKILISQYSNHGGSISSMDGVHLIYKEWITTLDVFRDRIWIKK